MLDIFLVELDRRPAQIRDLLADGGWNVARATARSIKGAALSVGATAVSEAAAAIEDWPETSAKQAAVDASAMLDAAAAIVKALLIALLDTGSDEDRASA